MTGAPKTIQQKKRTCCIDCAGEEKDYDKQNQTLKSGRCHLQIIQKFEMETKRGNKFVCNASQRFVRLNNVSA